MQSWPTELVAEAEYKVKLLSGMIAPVTDDQAASGEEGYKAAEPVTAEKPSPVS